MVLNVDSLEMFRDDCVLYVLVYFSSIEIFRLLQDPRISLRLVRLLRYYLKNCNDFNTDLLNLCELKLDEFCKYTSEYANSIKRLILNNNSLYTYNNNHCLQYLDQIRKFNSIEHLSLLNFEEIVNVQITSHTLVSIDIVFPSYQCQMVDTDNLYLLLYQCTALQYIRLRNTVVSQNSLACLTKLRRVFTFSATDCIFPGDGSGVTQFLRGNPELRDLEIVWLYKENANYTVINAIFDAMFDSLRSLKTLSTLLCSDEHGTVVSATATSQPVSTTFSPVVLTTPNTTATSIITATTTTATSVTTNSCNNNNHNNNNVASTNNNNNGCSTNNNNNIIGVGNNNHSNITLVPGAHVSIASSVVSPFKSMVMASTSSSSSSSLGPSVAPLQPQPMHHHSATALRMGESSSVEHGGCCLINSGGLVCRDEALLRAKAVVPKSNNIINLRNLEYVTLSVPVDGGQLDNIPEILSGMESVRAVSLVELWYLYPIDYDLFVTSRKRLRELLNRTKNPAKFSFRPF